MTWIPFDTADQMVFEYRLGVEPPYHTIEVRCVSSRVGDTWRFVCSRDSYWAVASPVDDVGVPVAPTYNADGLQRVDAIKIRHRDPAEITDFLRRIRIDFDEYVRTTRAMADANMHDSERYTFG